MRLITLVLVLSGCASAVPTMMGASTTPRRRTDLVVGGSARVPTGDLREAGPGESRARDAADTGGVVPVGVVRHGLTRHLDVGLMIAGTVARVELRGETGAREGSTRSTWMWAVAPYAGVVGDRDGSGSGARFGLDLPLAYGIDFGGLYDVWIGPRLAFEGMRGSFDQAPDVRADAWQFVLRAGGTVGMAAGFRRVHALLEVTVAWEQQWGEHGDQSLNRGGFVVIPAFGLRLRI